MLISISAYTFDFFGNFIVDADAAGSSFSSVARRVSRTATLDGGALVVDNGYTAADATFDIDLAYNVTTDVQAQIVAMIKRNSYITVSGAFGCFRGVVESVNEAKGCKLRVLIDKNLTE